MRSHVLVVVLVGCTGSSGGGTMLADGGGSGDAADSRDAGDGGSVCGDAGSGPQILAETPLVQAVALHSGMLYWLSAGRLLRMPACGGMWTSISGDPMPPGQYPGLAIDDAGITWTAMPDRIERVALAGGNPTQIYQNGHPAGVAADDQAIFAAADDTLVRIAIADGAVQILASGLSGARGIAIDSDFAYWNETTSGLIRRIAKTGGNVQDLATGQFPWAIAVDESTVYWTAASAGSGVLMATPKAGGTSTPLVVSTGTGVAVATDDAFVYWLEPGGGNDRLMRVAKAGGTPTLLADGQQADPMVVSQLAVDTDGVYWRSGDRIMRLAK